MGKLNVSYSGDETDASVQRGEFSTTFLLTNSVFVDPFLKFRPGQGPGRARGPVGPWPRGPVGPWAHGPVAPWPLMEDRSEGCSKGSAHVVEP